MTLPPRSCHGRTAVRRISTILLPFSSTTPMATQVQIWMSSMNRMTTITIAITLRTVASSPLPLRVTSFMGGTRRACPTLAGSRPAAVRFSSVATVRWAVSRITDRPRPTTVLEITVAFPTTAASTSPSATALRAAASSA